MTHQNDSTVREIVLRNGLIVLIDAEDWDRVSARKWYASKSHRTIYAVCQDRSQWPWRTIPLHRLILNAPDGVPVDHINHNGLDNRKCNLRLVTRAQNQQNRRAIVGREGMKGVEWIAQRRKWRSRIRASGKTYYLGYFETIQEAAKAYDVAAKQLHGEFALLNYPSEQSE